MNKFDDAVNLLTSSGKFYIKLGLERISAILELLGNPQDKLKCIHVAGTNGKGSVCSMINKILIDKGFKTGLFTSPHIFDYTERIRINDINISKNIFADMIFEISKLADENQIHLTEFEILTAVMFKYFADNKVDFAVIEVGLGGRYDSTNVIKKPLCSVITTIDFDHTERLGNTIEKIASEKAGIIKQNCPVVISPDNRGLNTVKSLCTKEQLHLAKDFKVNNISLKGEYQKTNANLALTAISIILPEIPLVDMLNSLQHVKHFGRFQYFKEQNLLIDGGHNPNGIRALRESLDTLFKDVPKRFIFGCLKNKDYPQMIKLLFKENDIIYFNQFSHKNSASYEELSSVCSYKSNEFKGTLPHFDGLTVICGSLYMISEVLKQLNLMEYVIIQ